MSLSAPARALAATATAVVLLLSTVAACTTAGRRTSGPGGPPAAASRTAPPLVLAGNRPRASAPAPSGVPAGVSPRLGPWVLIGRAELLRPLAGQGLATVRTPGGTTTVYRGGVSVTGALEAQGWDHVGDPDSWAGWLVDAFQGGPGIREKMFRVTSPSGEQTEVVHPLAPGEAPNNSFAAITPDGQWTLSAEWGTERRLLVFPTPVLNPAGRAGSPLPLAGVVTLARPVRDLQGCAVATPTRLLCAASDPGRDLWPTPDQLLQMDLGHALRAAPGGASTSATVHEVGELPLSSPCQGTYEPEGMDLRRPGDLRVEVTPPGQCNLVTQIYQYRLAP